MRLSNDNLCALAGLFRQVAAILENATSANASQMEFNFAVEPLNEPAGTIDQEAEETHVKRVIVNHNPGYSIVSNIARHYHISTRAALAFVSSLGIATTQKDGKGRQYIEHKDVARLNRAIISGIRWTDRPYNYKS